MYKLILASSSIKLIFLSTSLVLLVNCSKSDDRAEPVVQVKHEPKLGKAARTENRLLDQAYSGIMWLDYARLINRRLMDRRKESGYQLAEAIIVLNRVLSPQGIKLESLQNKSVILDQFEVKKALKLIRSVSNDLSKTAESLQIDWYDLYREEGPAQLEQVAMPELRDLIFINQLLGSQDDDKSLFEFINTYFDVDMFLKSFFEEKIKTGKGTLTYFLDVQFEIYAQSKFHLVSSKFDSVELDEIEEIVWSNLLAFNQEFPDDKVFKKSQNRTILDTLIEADRNTLLGRPFSSTSPLENWYLKKLRKGQVDVCVAIDTLKKLNSDYYMDHFTAFNTCDCWQDYTRHIIISSTNLLALQRVKNGNWPINDSFSIDCLDDLTDHYFEVTGEPKDFRYGKISPYFFIPYTLLASENGSHQPFFLQYMADQVDENVFFRVLHSLNAELTMFSPGGV